MAFKINAFDLVALNSPNYGKNTWHRQTVGYPTVLRFRISLFQLNLCKYDEKIGQKFPFPDFCSVWDPLTRSLLKTVPKQALLASKYPHLSE